MDNLNHLSATDIVDLISLGQVSAEDVTRACLRRIAERDEFVQAFEYLDEQYAIEQAKFLDAAPHRGLLHGVPIGVKDCFETFDMPTGWGVEFYAGRNTGRDAAIVTSMRAAGAVILGKTVTSELVAFWPGKTRNPYDLDRTTGVSSMGSAAGVADMMMPIGLATQSGGSTIRPAAHCGVMGYKASHSEISTDGLMVLQPTCDSIGFLARDISDFILMRRALLAATPAVARGANEPPRIALVRTPHWLEAEVVTHDIMEEVVEKLCSAGATITEPSLSEKFNMLTDAHLTIQYFEVARCRAFEWENYRESISDPMLEFISKGKVSDLPKVLSKLSSIGHRS